MNLFELISNHVNGASFVTIDTETVVKLKGGRKNPQQGRVTKRVNGSNVMVFQNKTKSGYGAMVERRLEKEGKDPATFQLSPRTWGTRLDGVPFVEHNGKYYLEVIFLHAGEVQYLLDGQPININEIEGLPPRGPEGEQGGLNDKVIIRTYSVESIKAISIDHNRHTNLTFSV